MKTTQRELMKLLVGNLSESRPIEIKESEGSGFRCSQDQQSVVRDILINSSELGDDL